MLFNSPEYIFLFLPFTVLVYFLLARQGSGYRSFWLVSASLFFYGYWNPVYLWIIIGSVLFNFIIARQLGGAKNLRKTMSLTLGIVANLGLLGFFKYTNFLVENLNPLFESKIPRVDIVLPLAISFFTFQQIAYLVDSSKSQVKHHSLLEYSLFVTFFPQLIAGPIVHHREMMPQFADESRRWVNWQNICAGIIVFSIGLFKKVVIADSFAVWADAGFDSDVTLSMTEAWAATLSYTFQLYFDFSGYCDMAIGAALLFNIHIPMNFNSPYKALNIQDFWRRWHVTLSRFLRDYIYVPLGGNQVRVPLIYTNLLITFLVGGLWHGAGWNFIIWGALNGIAIVLHRIWFEAGLRMNRFAAWGCTFLFTCFAWVFFRSSDIETALGITRSLIDIDSLTLSQPFLDELSAVIHYPVTFLVHGSDVVNSERALVASLLALIIVMFFKNSWQIKEQLTEVNAKIPWGSVIGAGLLSGISWMFLFGSSSRVFLYYNF
jgi:D-alanyl-lipoteichoic acid acyltransferase DltB (MBOAT superfamily)